MGSAFNGWLKSFNMFQTRRGAGAVSDSWGELHNLQLRVDDLAGSAGAQRLRMELLRRVNLAMAPAQVNAVLIEEMLVQ